MKRSLFLICAVFASNLMAMKPDKIDYHELGVLLKDLDAKKEPTVKSGVKIGAKCLGAYGFFTAGVLAHELGHAVTGKLFTDSPIRIALGSHKVSKKTLTLNGFNPLIGVTYIEHISKASSLENIIIDASGPFFGVVFNCAILMGINIIDEYKKNNSSIMDAIKKGYSKPLFSNANTKEYFGINYLCWFGIIRNLDNLIALHKGSDGDSIIKNSGPASILISATAGAGIGFALKKYIAAFGKTLKEQNSSRKSEIS